jgi:hypothetical protein
MFLFCAPRHRNAAGIPAFALTKEVHVMKLKPRKPAPAGGKIAERRIKRAIGKISEQKKHRPDREEAEREVDASIERALELHAKDVARATDKNTGRLNTLTS